ncbi:MAG: GTPase [Shackletoniella antarctica]|uniref:GTPase n=1 Tax=Shackletoniella antarctica TaxID=268115 RepID=A0A2W4W1N8_9CYAN|nr:MAG: GTPase [Shackletoniella antarctica]
MVSTPPSFSPALDYSFLLLTHVICADQQIHSQESLALRDLANQTSVNEATLQEIEKILGQDEAKLSLEEAAQRVPIGQRSEAFRQVLAIAYIDGYFSPLEREIVNYIAQLWGIQESEIEQILEAAQGFKQWQNRTDEGDNGLSTGARLLKGTESLLSKSLVRKLSELAPEFIGQRIEHLQREILLSGPEYDEAIQQCAKIAREDFRYADQSLRMTFTALRDLGNGIQQVIENIKQKTTGDGDQQTAKEVAKQLEQTQQNLSAEILHDLEQVRKALQAKQRALNHFSIAFMGRTKAGKSTLHAIITGEGWEAIGIGKQRTTRYNRIYEWKNIRIIDTPGIGAPGGKTDEEIARSVIEEADVICYVVTDDSIQESEFAFLKVLKEKTKPLIVLLNIRYNLRDSLGLEDFLRDPDRWFALEGKSGIGGHLSRINRYAKQHYPNDYLEVIPAMLLAAQLSQEPEHQAQARKLFKVSRIQDFLNSIRASLIDYGTIRRSQTLLGSTVGSIDRPQQWVTYQAGEYSDLARRLDEKRQELKAQAQKAKEDGWAQLQLKINEVFQDALNQVTPFAERHWDSDKGTMEHGWKKVLESCTFEDRLKIAAEEASHHFQDSIQEAIDEIGTELKLISRLKSGSFSFSKQDSSFLDKDFIRISGMVMVAAGAILAFVFPPLALMSVVGGIVGWVSSWFESRHEKRHKAVKEISKSLRSQIEKQHKKVIDQSERDFESYCQSISVAVDNYFEELTQGIDEIANQLKSAQGKLSSTTRYLNRAYAKRITDWASDQYEPLTDIAISKRIRRTDRVFGHSFLIQTTSELPLTKSQKEICRILQEEISIQSINSQL